MCCSNCRAISSTTRPYRFVGSRDEEIAYINKETRRLEESIRSLHKEKAALLHRLNALSSPMSSLPVETMSTIFEFACPPYNLDMPQFLTQRSKFLPSSDDADTKEYDHFQLVLGAVSAHWRGIARATPRLWSSTALDISPANAEDRAAFLRLCLENSRWTPIYLKLSYSDCFISSAPGLLIHESVDRILIDSLPRCRELHLIQPPSTWFPHFPSLSQLADCSIDTDNPLSRELVIHSAAPLRHFSIQVPGRPSQILIQIPWSGLTSLVVSQLELRQAVDMLKNCPNLIEFRCCGPHHAHTALSSPVTLVEPLALQQLEILELSASGDCDWARAVVQHLHVPSLRQLEWNVDHTSPGDILAFFNRLPSTLSTVVLHNSSHLKYLRSDSHLERLTLQSCEMQDLKAFFESLNENVFSDRDHPSLVAFPKLMELSLMGYIMYHFQLGGVSLDTSLDPDITNRLFLAAMEKRQGSGVSFRFNTSDLSTSWDPLVKERLKELVLGGFDLKIADKSGEVLWL